MTHLLYSLLYGQEVSIGPSVVQNIPCRRKGPEGLHLYGGSLHMKNDENSETKRRENKEFLNVTDWYPTLINLVGED